MVDADVDNEQDHGLLGREVVWPCRGLEARYGMSRWNRPMTAVTRGLRPAGPPLHKGWGAGSSAATTPENWVTMSGTWCSYSAFRSSWITTSGIMPREGGASSNHRSRWLLDRPPSRTMTPDRTVQVNMVQIHRTRL